MSYIAFHSLQDEVRVRGSERALMGMICHRQLEAQLNFPKYEPNFAQNFIRFAFPEDHYLNREGIRSYENCLTALHIGEVKLNHADGDTAFDIQLNSAMVAGSDVIRLCAKLHGQCELHAYVEGHNRSWLAGLIQKALNECIFRKESGWEQAIELLNNDDSSPVVTSYSVCESFPNPYLPSDKSWWDKNAHDDPYEPWDELSEEKRWDLCITEMRNREGLEISPFEWSNRLFGNGMTGFKYMRRFLEWQKQST